MTTGQMQATPARRSLHESPSSEDDGDGAKLPVSVPRTVLLHAQAIEVGFKDAELALKRAGFFKVLRLFARDRERPLADPKLEALRGYAELSRVLWAHGRRISSDSLARSGFGPAEIVAIEGLIVRRLASV